MLINTGPYAALASGNWEIPCKDRGQAVQPTGGRALSPCTSTASSWGAALVLGWQQQTPVPGPSWVRCPRCSVLLREPGSCCVRQDRRTDGTGRTEQPGERATLLGYVPCVSVSVLRRYAYVYNGTYVNVFT